MSKITDLPISERPREKAKRYGISSLSDSELLAILLRSGYVGSNANDIANIILSSSCGLIGLSNSSLNDLKKFKGVKESKALILASVFEIHKRLSIKENENNPINNDWLYQKYRYLLSDAFQESLILVVVNSKNTPIYEKQLYQGNEIYISFSFNDLYRELLIHKGKGFYLIHNHPGGNHQPSNNDILLTVQIMKECKKIHIPLIDHLVISENGYSSITEILKAEHNPAI